MNGLKARELIEKIKESHINYYGSSEHPKYKDGYLTGWNDALDFILRKAYDLKKENTIKIKYFSEDIEKIGKIDKGDWIDLRAAEDVELKAGEFKIIKLGVGMILPEGYEAHIVPRSSTFKNFGIIQTNHQAVIDESYCGDDDQWCYPAYALRDTVIHKNDRICQFRIVEKQPGIVLEEVNHLKDKNRGGFGSTGKM